MSFTFPSLFYVWLVPLVALPVLIHLINLLRHRRVKWAAMEFLLESRKKHQNWVRLKQLLLLLLRMAAIAVLVFLMAGPLLKDQWSRLFGGGKTHHVILLDDSGSMADRWSDTSAFDRARDVVRNVVARANRQNTEQTLTLLRFSRAAGGEPPELLRQPITTEFAVDFDSYRDKIHKTQLAVGPMEALETIQRTVEPDEDENLVVYIVSDLRAAEWQDATALKQALARFEDLDAQLQLVHCVDQARPNLAVTGLAPTPGQQATDVLIRMEVEVTNFSTQTARNVAVQLQQRVFTSADDEEGEIGSLGAVKFDRIEPGATARRAFDVTFSVAGHHEVTARLPSDAIAADNERFCVLDVAPEVPVLIVDGGGEDDPLYLRLALAPSPRVRTGLKAKVEPTTVLRSEPLDQYHTIYLVNISQLDQAEVDALEDYVRGGGGLVFFAGDATRRDLVNAQLYRDGEGFFPAPLAAPTTLLVDRLDKAPDIVVDHEHPIFSRTFADKYNSWLQKILVQRYFAVAKEWDEAADPHAAVIARLRNGDPLIIEKKFGAGRVLAVLMTASPVWHNWGLANPTYIVAALETQVYLGAGKSADALQEIGTPLEMELVEDEYVPDLEIVVPDEADRRKINSHAQPDKNDPSRLTVALQDTTRSGVYELRLKRMDGTPETRRVAFNVPAVEGDLDTVYQPQLQKLLGGVPFQYRDATEFLAPVEQQAGFPLAEQWWFFLALILILVVEQLLAYSASYHPPLTGGRGG